MLPSDTSGIDPVFARKIVAILAEKYSCVSPPEYVLIDEAWEKSSLVSLRAPYKVFAGSDIRCVRHRDDVSLAVKQLQHSEIDKAILIEPIKAVNGLWTLGFVQQGDYLSQGSFDIDWADDIHQFPMGITYPSAHALNSLEPVIHDLCSELSLEDSVLSIVWGFDEERGTYTLLSLRTALIPSDLPEDLLELTGITGFHANHERLLNGEKVIPYSMPSKAASLCWLHSHSGIVESVEGMEVAQAVDGLEAMVIQVHPGDRIGHVLDIQSRDALGYVVATGSSPQEARTRAQDVSACIQIHTQTLL